LNRNKEKLGIRISILLLFILAVIAMAPVGSAYADVEAPSPEEPEIGQIEYFVTRFDEDTFNYLIPFQLIQYLPLQYE